MAKLKDIPIKLTAVSASLILVSALAPMLAIPLLMLSVVPQVIMIKKGELRKVLISWAAVTFLIYGLFGPVYVMTYVVLFILFAAVIAKSVLPYEESVYRKVGKMALVWFLFFMLWQAFAYLIFKVNVAEVIIKSIESSMAVGLEKYYKAGLPVVQIEMIGGSVGTVLEYFKSGFTGWVFVSATAGSYVFYYTLSKYMEIKRLPALNLFRPDEDRIWYLIGALCIYIAGVKFGSFSMLSVVGINGLIVLLAGYSVSGFGVFSLMASKIGLNSFFKVLFLAAVFIFLKGIIIFAAAGI
nr:DUF2232 domain-containing protein [Elusimicrobiota bacterium]